MFMPCSAEPDLPPVVALLSGALDIILTDTVYDYQNLYGGYSTSTLLDVGWRSGYILVALAPAEADAFLARSIDHAA